MSYFAKNIETPHCFFGRKGGKSQGLYASLNVNTQSGDNPDNVAQNLAIIADFYHLSVNSLMLIKQGVSGHAEYTDKASQRQITADGIVTDQKDIVLCIGTADCAPVLFHDKKHGIIGAAHAGWRGAVRGIVENTVKIMLEHGAETNDIAAAVGPCLQQQSFEIGLDMYREFLNNDKNYASYFSHGKDNEHFWFDMEKFVIDKLKSCGINNISASGINTYAEEENYFSYRRNCHQGLVQSPKDFPVHLSTICL